MKKFNLIFLLSFFCFFISTKIMVAQNPGDLDPSFGTGGIVTTDVGNYDFGSSVAVQSDGKIIIAGSSDGLNGYGDFALVRYNSNGTLDNSFSSDGIVTTAVSYYYGDNANSIVIQNDGKIVVAGTSYINLSGNGFALARYNPDGILDNTFSGNGIVTTVISANSDEGMSIAIQNDDKILVAGYSNAPPFTDFATVRYNTDGTLDTSFASDGINILDIGGGIDVANSLIIQSDGKIVVAGYSENLSTGRKDFAIVRYNSDGSLDTTFSYDGIIITDISGDHDIGRSVALQTDGKIIVAGGAFDGSEWDCALVRYNSDGTLDTTFSSDGIVITDLSIIWDQGWSVAVQTDGKILVAANPIYDSYNFYYDFSLLRYNSDGTLDTTFSSDGIVNTDIDSTDDVGISMVIQPDGKIIVAGYSDDGINYDFAVMRFIGNTGTSVEEQHEKYNSRILKVYPNPSNDVFNIEFNYFTVQKIDVVNIMGEFITTIKNSKSPIIKIDLSDYPSGIYFVKVSSDEGVKTGKIVKQ